MVTRRARTIAVIDLQRETLLSFAAAGRYLASVRGGRPAAPSTFYRWATRGLRGHTLEVVRCGGRVVTSAEALQRFFDALTGSTVPTPIPAPTATPSATKAELDRLGI
jgi:hypothetical protein